MSWNGELGVELTERGRGRGRGGGGKTVEYSEQLLVINRRPRSMHCIIARRRRQNGNNSFKISANKSQRAKLEGSKRGRECEKDVKERGIIRRMREIRKSTLFG